MTTLAKDTPRTYELGERNNIGVIASDIIYAGSAVGDNGSGYARPLVAGDVFLGFATLCADNSNGSAGDINVLMQTEGRIELAVSGALITDVGLPVYAQDDNTFSFIGTGGTFIGYITRFVSAGVAIVAFNTEDSVDPWGLGIKETLAGATLTIDAEDVSKVIFCTVTTVVTLPVTATAGLNITFVNASADGVGEISLDPAAADLIQGPNFAGTVNKDLINTLASAKRGDYVTVSSGHADGWTVTSIKGTWATES